MTDYKALINEAREYAGTDEYGGAVLLRETAVAVEALAADRDSLLQEAADALVGALAERDALRAQLDNMTTEWGYRDRDGWSGVTAEDEGHARRMGSRHPGEIVTVKRLVGGWVEVTD